MAQKIRVELVCDACEDGRPAQRTLGFAFDDENGDRSEYKIELCAQTHGSVRRSYAAVGGNGSARAHKPRPRAAAGAKAVRNNVVSARQGNGRTPARRGAEQVAAIRTWARSHGYTVAEKGRIPSEIEEAYNRQASAPQSLSV